MGKTASLQSLFRQAIHLIAQGFWLGTAGGIPAKESVPFLWMELARRRFKNRLAGGGTAVGNPRKTRPKKAQKNSIDPFFDLV